jgi:hypothetical protein
MGVLHGTSNLFERVARSTTCSETCPAHIYCIGTVVNGGTCGIEVFGW